MQYVEISDYVKMKTLSNRLISCSLGEAFLNTTIILKGKRPQKQDQNDPISEVPRNETHVLV
ncbi:hypothetical protein GCM10011482_20140 [Enterococcus alcedinis]|uniref:Uncharacterized protein n=1 Tax=Enterococcus alcedinis TaxID=1274384 RepID=A0A917JIB9_9ENTE|nr:hypothetical protein GCM10011482_20140 [Enterococcus alcedinis]